ncbi:MAG TPA: glycosyltransferase family 39 protein [Planctomycetota bacterium]|nr:glycosyltransferase family 39 protein [Planctomycetota bacterium]
MSAPDALPARRLAAVVLVGLVARLAFLGRDSFWHDESWTWGLIRGGPGLLFSQLRHQDAHPPLYFLLVQAWSVFGTSEAWLRLFSAILGTLSLPLLYRFTARLGTPTAGLAATMLAAVAPLLLHYSAEARSYALLNFLALGSLNLLLDLRDRPDRRRWGAWAVATAAILYTHYMGAFFILSEAALLLAWRRARPGLLREAALAAAGASLLFLPWLPVFIDHASSIERGFWIPAPTPRTVLDALAGLVVHPWAIDGGLGYVRAALVYGLAVAAPFLLRRRELGALLLLVVVPPLAELLVSLRRPVFYLQTFQYVLPSLLALAGLALTRLPARAAAMSAAALALFVLLPGARRIYEYPVRENWRGAARVLDRAHRGEPIVVAPGYVGISLEYYGRGGAAWLDDLRLAESGDLLRQGRPTADLLSELSSVPAVWLVHRYDADEGWRGRLSAAGFSPEYAWTTRNGDVHVRRYVRR